VLSLISAGDPRPFTTCSIGPVSDHDCKLQRMRTQERKGVPSQDHMS